MAPRRLFGTAKKANKFIRLNDAPAPEFVCSCGAELQANELVAHEDQGHIPLSKHDADMAKELEFDAYSRGDLDL